MNVLLRIIISVLLLILTTNLSGQNPTVLSGILLSKTDSAPIAQAHIINRSAKLGVISNDQGDFNLSCSATDTVSISVIGYQTIVLVAKELNDTIFLQQKNYQLELFNLMPYKTYAEFKEAFVKLDLPDDSPQINSSIYLSREELSGLGHRGSGIIVSGAISSIFASFNKLMQDKITYEQLLKRDEYEAFIATKFNAKLVHQITQMKSKVELNEFITYCDFNNYYIQNSSNYTIITQIFDCYEEYASLPMASK